MKISLQRRGRGPVGISDKNKFIELIVHCTLKCNTTNYISICQLKLLKIKYIDSIKAKYLTLFESGRNGKLRYPIV